MNEWSERLLAESVQELEELQTMLDLPVDEYAKRTVKKFPDMQHLTRNNDVAFAFRTGQASAKIKAVITNLNLIKKWEKEDKDNDNE